MTFDIFTIALFGGGAVIYSALVRPQWRGWALMIASIITVYWLQPRLPIRFSDFILPTMTLVLAVIGWVFTQKPDQHISREDHFTLIVTIFLIIGMACFRYIDADFRITPSRPPNPLWVVAGLIMAGSLIWGLSQTRQTVSLPITGIGFIVAVFVALKTDFFATGISDWGRALTGQDRTLAGAIDLNWVGFSYIAFRLIHTLRDRQTGLLPELSLREYMTYIIFFPAFIAGPIDRAERFQQDLQQLTQLSVWDAARWTNGLTRIGIGLFKKFVIADTLAAGLALNGTNAAQAESTLWLWVLLYGYSLRLFFDFAGYSDIAIGIGILFGIHLPENFTHPYLKTDITNFWKSWHITLSNWARFYVFSPLSRELLRRKPKPSPLLIVLVAQLATMIVIGLWHGVTWNFIVWGVWHGIGLFLHKQWTERTRKWERKFKQNPMPYRVYCGAAWLLTFHFIALGWVWFALPTINGSVDVFACLFGMCS